MALLLATCRPNSPAGSEVKPERNIPLGKAIVIPAPLGLPPVPVPADNPVTADSVALGRKLFYDKRLSKDNSISCASCHNPELGFVDGHKHSLGVGAKEGTRNAPTIVNAAYDKSQFWDGRSASLEEQVGSPMASDNEMAQPHEIAVKKLQADPAYQKQFQQVFGPGPVTMGKVQNAIASFERTLISGNSPFDRFQYGGEKTAISPAAQRGLAVFLDPGKGNCNACHTIGSKYALFTDGKFHNIGVGVNDQGEVTDVGRFSASRVEGDRGAFKTPSLRNVARSAPYMHDGSLKTLKDVVDFYAGGGNSNPHLDPNMKKIHLSGGDRADLVEFLKTLSSETPPNAGPPPSGT